ncbi:MAG: nuclease-related domain-containing protein [Leifsonia flava]
MTALSPEVDPARNAAATLRTRAAGASVITRCLAEQSQVPDRGRLARVLGRSPLSEESRSWYLGALGELAVAARLKQLGPDWTVLHSVPVGHGESDIDHVVIGPSGVYTINTKHHDDGRVWVGARKLLVNGQPTDYLRNSRHEAERATRLLSAAAGTDIVARPVIAVVGAKSITVKQQPSDVMVLADTQLVRWLRRRRRTPALVTTPVVAAAEHPSTWHSNAAEALADANLEQFASLQHEVRTARDVRAIWVGGGVVAVGTVAVTQLMPTLALMFG